MKKYIKTALLCVFAVIVCVSSLYAAVRYFGLEISFGEKETTAEVQTTQPQTTAPTTTEATTAAETTTAAPTTSQTQPETLIDLNNLTVIDLYPLSLAGGGWDVKHCQGIAVDAEKGYIYYSYTTILVKCDFDGNIVGTVSGIEGHLGDITFNKKDGKIYCGYYAEGRKGFYIVIFDADKITKKNMKPTGDLVRTVFLPEAYNDYCAKVLFETDDSKQTLSHKYGCSGIDGVSFGPDFSGKIKNKELLTVAYGIYSEPQRTDNDYQVLLQYDVSSWWSSLSKPYSSKEFHRTGPQSVNGKYFVYTGNTTYGVQTMEYFDELNLWILSCYKGKKEMFSNFSLFAIDGDVAPKREKLKGQSTEDKQLVLSLYQDGSYDKKNDIYGWYSSYGVQGIAYMGDGLFYIVRPYKSWTGTKTAICYLNVWAPQNSDPFTLAAGIGTEYTISKKPRVEPTTKPKTTAAPTTDGKESQKTETEKSAAAQLVGSLLDALT